MTKREFISAVAENTGVTKKDTETVVNGFFDVVAKTLAEGDKVALIGFGTFEPVERAARECRNPQTGETVFVPAKKAVKFKCSKVIKAAVNE